MYPKKRWTDQVLDSTYRHYCVLLYLNLLFDIQAHIFAQQYNQMLVSRITQCWVTFPNKLLSRLGETVIGFEGVIPKPIIFTFKFIPSYTISVTRLIYHCSSLREKKMFKATLRLFLF